jgi:hypothetical protein
LEVRTTTGDGGCFRCDFTAVAYRFVDEERRTADHRVGAQEG